MNYGTYTTMDCPTKKEDEAYDWLQSEFGHIGGKVRRLINPHDFGSYPSFEVDMPEEYEFLIEDCDDGNIETETLLVKKDAWVESANNIEREYSNKFGKYL